MKFSARSVAWLLPVILTGCFHFGHRPPAQPLAPAIPSSKSTPPAVEHPPLEATIPSVPLASGASVQPAPRPRVRHRKPAIANGEQAAASTALVQLNTPQAPANTQQAASESPGVSAIGQLSSGDTSNLRQQTVDSIAAIERSLSGIGSSLSDQEQKTAAQIREYLKQARNALASGDVDGAHTLVAKANVLLSELSR
ncbi:MAG: hypothetical protein ABR898_09955 [Terracidiphilus sp.]